MIIPLGERYEQVFYMFEKMEGQLVKTQLVPTLFVLQAVSGPAAFPSHAAVHSARRPWGILLAACLVADVALTFVTPALALSVRSCRESLRRGFRTLGETWPSCALYALTPGIAFVAISVWVPTPGGVLGSALVAAAGGLLALWFKGAVVAFYLRLHPRVADSGAAYADEPARPPRRRA